MLAQWSQSYRPDMAMDESVMRRSISANMRLGGRKRQRISCNWQAMEEERFHADRGVDEFGYMG